MLMKENNFTIKPITFDGGFISIVIMAQFWLELDQFSELLKARTKVRLQQNHIKPNL